MSEASRFDETLKLAEKTAEILRAAGIEVYGNVLSGKGVTHTKGKNSVSYCGRHRGG